MHAFYSISRDCNQPIKLPEFNKVLYKLTIYNAYFILENKDGWYQRYENNGWRLVSDRV